jgi:hypothetical protein
MSALKFCRLFYQKIYMNNAVFFCNADDFSQLNWHWNEHVLYSYFTVCCYSNLSLQLVACFFCHEKSSRNIILGFEVFVIKTLRIADLWDVLLCSVVEIQPEDGGSTLLWNSVFLPGYLASYPRRW